MDTWNYRICEYSDGYLGIHEVHYGPNGPEMVTVNPVSLTGYENITDFLEDFELIREAAKYPVLSYDEITEE